LGALIGVDDLWFPKVGDRLLQHDFTPFGG
jgi:hypothetical protein